MIRFSKIRFFLTFALLCSACGATASASTNGIQTLRIAAYNIEDDINGATTPLPGLIAPSGGGTVEQGGVVEGIGEEILAGDPAQPLDILALEETTSNPVTVAPIVNGLNSFYNAPGMYAMSPYQATEEGGVTDDGNGPNALVYNTTTLQLVASVGVDPPGGANQLGSTSGEYREVVRYAFSPAGVVASPTNEFYVYVSHYKSGTTSADLVDRAKEAQIIRNGEATNLPANARVLYVGDYNVTGSGEASYITIIATNAPDGAAQGQGIDPLNVSEATNIDWGVNSLLNLKTESATDLRYRDDFQVMTSNVYYGAPGGLALVPGTYHAFGNNGTTPYKGSVGSGSDTALNNDLEPNAPITAPSLYADLATASDHLPVVADYTIPVPTGFPAWQIQYFGSVTNPAAAPNFDADGTGQSNYFKYVAGLNPTNSSSVFAFSITVTSNQPAWKNLVFGPIAAGRTYTPQVETNLSSTGWTPLAALPAVTNGSQVTFTDTNASSQQEFYRINISLP
ncbi:MAG TPA: hypothetical protein VH595_22515 [Verrucomicrobiae bacterium]|jgi:hypothetical protein|nr:hypothetical protein [Verrucomicrobiae bacterium]